jgi:hypothetical protein
MKKSYVLATLSNGNVSLLVEMARMRDCRGSVIFASTATAKSKPAPATAGEPLNPKGAAPG